MRSTTLTSDNHRYQEVGSGRTPIVVISGRLLQHTTHAKFSLEASCISNGGSGGFGHSYPRRWRGDHDWSGAPEGGLA